MTDVRDLDLRELAQQPLELVDDATSRVIRGRRRTVVLALGVAVLVGTVSLVVLRRRRATDSRAENLVAGIDDPDAEQPQFGEPPLPEASNA